MFCPAMYTNALTGLRHTSNCVGCCIVGLQQSQQPLLQAQIEAQIPTENSRMEKMMTREPRAALVLHSFSTDLVYES